MPLNRRQLSLLITVLSLSIVVVVLFQIELQKKQAEEYLVELQAVLDDAREEEKTEAERAVDNNSRTTSQKAFNEAAKSSYGKPEPLKTLAELLEEQKASEQSTQNDIAANSDMEGYKENLKALREKRKKQQEIYGTTTGDKSVRTSNFKRNTTITYSLVNRTHEALPIPIYTCLEGGKVVVNISVARDGTVLTAEINKKSSTTSDWCLHDNAITYALQSKFNSVNTANQLGTITYLFQSK